MKKRYIRDLYINKLWYFSMGTLVICFCLSFFIPVLFNPALLATALLFIFSLADYALLFFGKGGVTGSRSMSPRFSLGDSNTVKLELTNTFKFRASVLLIDELPFQFQQRNFLLRLKLNYRAKEHISYSLRPLTRGEYQFGDLVCFVKTPFQLLQRRFITAEPEMVKVYPSYLQLKKFQLLALSDNLVTGVKKIRRLGHSLEFEKIKDYVRGDDLRTINWKATARSGALMVNTYTDTRQQQVYCLIDKGRAMKMPFDGMSLLDYAINATLVLLNIVLLKHDKAGLVTFSNKVNEIIPSERKNNQLPLILETLYKQQTDFKESDYESLWSMVHNRITQRSLLLFFTNFETYSSLARQLPFLAQMARRHLVCVVFFQNTLLKEIYDTQPNNIEGIYIKTVAEHFDFEKKQIVKELRRHGILSILTTPQNLTVDVINKYLELKARQML